MKAKEIKAILDLSAKKEWYFDSDEIRYLIDNGLTAQDLQDYGYDPDDYAELEDWAKDADLLQYETKGPVIDGQADMDKLAERLKEKFGYQLTAADRELILDLDAGADDVNWAGDYSYKFSPRTWCSIKEWAEDEHVGLL